jgi:hypothetical protein
MRTFSPKLSPLALVLVAPLACGDDGNEPTGGSISSTGATITATATLPGDTSSGGQPTDPSGPGVTETGIGMSDSESSPTSTSTSDPSTSTSTSTTEATTVAETTQTSGPVSASETGTTQGSTGPECACEPGSTDGCDGGQILTCSDDCQGFEPQPCDVGQSCVDGACTAMLCNPGQVVCDDAATEKTCNPQGDGFDPPVACGMTQECAFGQGCTELCELILGDPSSVGCVFRANKMQNFEEEPSAVTVGNVSKTLTATVSLYRWQNGQETMVGAAQMVLPGKSAQFDLTTPTQTPGTTSVLKPDSTYKIVSNVPVVAYQHSPIQAEAHNDSSMLLPDHAQQKNYMIMAYKPNVGGNPAYFDVIGLKDGTMVSWVPPVATVAGNGVPAVNAGAMGQVVIGDYDMLQVSSGQNDISGSIVTLSQPAWVTAAVQCVNVPAGVTFCDHIEEQMIPIEYWGTEYVGAHAPKRGSEDYWWRVYAAEDNTTINTAPAQAGFPKVLSKGQFYEFSTTQSFIFTGDKPFMPVQYLEGEQGGAGTGDPASYQMVPVEQFLDRYVFVTGIGYNPNYVQVVRKTGGPDVLVDGAVVNGYYAVGAYEVADWKISAGTHLAESDAQFGIYQVGYTGVTSYAYPGGLRLKVINPQ